MSDKEMNSYRFSSGVEPSDKMLRQLMKEVAKTARERREKASANFFRSLQDEAKSIKRTIVKK